MLISMAQPDANGNLIPSYIQEGSLVFSNPKGRAHRAPLNGREVDFRPPLSRRASFRGNDCGGRPSWGE
jgi:hypothetical protein